MPACCVSGCSNSVRKCARSEPKILFHRLPPNKILQQNWLQLCGRSDFTGNISHIRVCSDHFSSVDYDLLSSQHKLLHNSIPSQKLPGMSQSVQVTVTRKRSASERFNSNDQGNFTQSWNQLNIKFKKLQVKFKTSQLQVRVLKTMKKSLWHNKYVLARDRWNRKEKLYLSTVNRLNSRIRSLQQKNSHIIEQLDQILTPVQQSVIFENKTKTHWTTQEISKAVSLRAISTQAFDHVREVWRLPLPSISTLKRWCAKIQCGPGIIRMPLKVLGNLFEEANPIEKQCTLAFDEMAVENTVGYYSKMDQVIGPHKKMHVSSLRGIVGKWKQPIHFDFDFRYDVDSLLNLIKVVHESGLNVKAMVSDLGPENQGLLSKLGISPEKSWIQHPLSNSKIWVFADWPHMIKLLRNNVLDSGFKLGDGTLISKADFQELLDVDNSELKVAFKLTQKHLEYVGQERMRVAPAFHMFSATVACAMKKYLPEKTRIAEFIQLTNDASDILNSRIPIDEKNSFKSGFGINLTLQEKVSNEFAAEIKNMRVGRGRSLYPFQKGILVTIASLKGIYGELTAPPFNLKYLLASRFNQDHLENMFSILRGLGIFYTHPPPVECINRIKSFIISLSLNPKKSGNSKFYNDTEMSSKVLEALMELNIDHSMEASTEEILSAQWNDEDGVTEVDAAFTEITEEGWGSFIESLTISEQCEFGGQEYIAGFIAAKLKKKYPDLQNLAHHEPASWVQTLTRGGLAVPSLDWLSTFKNMNEIFLSFHRRNQKGLDLYTGYGVMSRLEDIISRTFTSLPIEIIKFFVRTRTFIRIRSINLKIKSTKRGKKRFF